MRTLQLKIADWDTAADGDRSSGGLRSLSEVRAAAAEWLLGIAFELMPKAHPHRATLRSCLGDYIRSTTLS